MKKRHSDDVDIFDRKETSWNAGQLWLRAVGPPGSRLRSDWLSEVQK
jgi:hypothetical protein